MMETSEAATLDPLMEAVPGAVAISGEQVVADLCAKIAEHLSRHDALRSSDAYPAYSAEVQIKFQLVGVDTTEVEAQVNVGTIDPAQPVQRVTLHAQAEGDAEPDQSLEKPIDPEGVRELPQPRRYATRGEAGRFLKRSN